MVVDYDGLLVHGAASIHIISSVTENEQAHARVISACWFISLKRFHAVELEPEKGRQHKQRNFR
jgi:hypothetical protein